MPLLLDTYNILHVVGVLPPEIAGIDTNGLARLLESSRWASQGCWLICDGTVKPGTQEGGGGVQIRFAGPGRTADEAIAQLVEKSSAPRSITVVSSDREVQRHARTRKCRVIDASEFLARLSEDVGRGPAARPSPAAPSTPLTGKAVRDWIRSFGVDDELNVQSSSPPKPPKAPRKTPVDPPTPDQDPPANPSNLMDAEGIDDVDLRSLDAFDMNDVIDEHGSWRGPDETDEPDESDESDEPRQE